jgi:hypothetical protein
LLWDELFTPRTDELMREKIFFGNEVPMDVRITNATGVTDFVSTAIDGLKRRYASLK